MAGSESQGFQEFLDKIKNFYFSIEDYYYGFMEWLESLGAPVNKYFVEPVESKGIPSFPVAVLIGLILLFGILFLLFPTLFSGSTGLRIVVSDEHGRLDGVNVELSGDGFTRSGVTKAGAVSFEGLPSGRTVQLNATKDGYKPLSRHITLGEKAVVTLMLQPSGSLVDVKVIVFDSDGLPVRAKVDYSYSTALSGEQVADSASTDSSGAAIVSAEDGSLVGLSVSATGYSTKTDSFNAARGLERQVTLSKKATVTLDSTPPNPFDDSNTKASLIVSVKDLNGSSLEAGISVFDSATNELLGESTSRFGTATINSINVGTTVKIRAELAGYEPATQTVTLKKTNNVVFRLQNIGPGTPSGNASESVIRVFDSSGAPLAADIMLMDFNSTIVASAKGATVLRATLSRSQPYYAIAYRQGFLYGKTLRFQGGQQKNITLFAITATNSANLSVSTYDEDSRLIIQPVTLAIFDSDGDMVPPFGIKTLNGKRVIDGLPRGVTLTVAASKPPQAGRQAISLALADNPVNVTLFYPKGILRVRASDFDGRIIQGLTARASLESDSGNALVASCTAAGVAYCDLELRIDKRFNVTVTAPNYDVWSGSRNPVVENVTEVNATLVRLDSSQITLVRLKSLEDGDGKVVASLVSDQYYVARFDLFLGPTTQKGGIGVTVADVNGQPIAAISNYSYGRVPAVARGSASLADKLTCDANNYALTSLDTAAVRWLETEYSFTGVQEVAVVIKVDASFQTGNLSIGHRAFAVSSGEYFRSPQDAALGTSLQTTAKSWCSAAEKNSYFAVSSCGGLNALCCTTRTASDGRLDACNAGYQCLANSCTFPTTCSSPFLSCSDNNVCCNVDGGKYCSASSSCASPSQCIPNCAPGQYCDSSGPVGSPAICKPAACGAKNQVCCADNVCNSGFSCDDSSGACKACGGLGQVCCAAGEASTCSGQLQCSPASNTCANPIFCGSAQNKCTDSNVCCKDSAHLGQCTAADACTSISACQPTCELGEYCDASNPNTPTCKACDASHCEFGGPGGLCTRTLPCTSGACSFVPGEDYGICAHCGLVGEACCAGNSCSQRGTVCSSDNACVSGSRVCSTEVCLEVTFSQPQFCFGAVPSTNCQTTTGVSGFQAHSLINCDEGRCDDGNLSIKYRVEILNHNSLRYPAVFNLSLDSSQLSGSSGIAQFLRPLRVISSKGDVRHLNATQGYVTVTVTDANWLNGTIVFAPNAYADHLTLNASYSNAGSSQSTFIYPWLSITNATPSRTQGFISSIFSCEALNLTYAKYPRGDRVEANCQKVVFKIDPIFPADAIPMIYAGFTGGICTQPNFAVYDAEKKRDLNLQKCFNFDARPDKLAFRFNALYPGCPYASQTYGNNVPTLKAYINASCTGALTDPFTIEVEVLKGNNDAIDAGILDYKRNIAGVAMHPHSYYLWETQDYSPLRLAYFLNNRGLQNPADTIKASGTAILAPRSDTQLPTLSLVAYDTSKGPAVITSAVLGRDLTIFSLNRNTSQGRAGDIARSSLSLGAVTGQQSAYNSCLASCGAEASGSTPGATACTPTATCNDGFGNSYYCTGANHGEDRCAQKYEIDYWCETDVNCTLSFDNAENPVGCIGSNCKNATRSVCSASCLDTSSCFPTLETCTTASTINASSSCVSACLQNYEGASADYYAGDYPRDLLRGFVSWARETAIKGPYRRSYSNTLYCTTQTPTDADWDNPLVCKDTYESWFQLVPESDNYSAQCMFCEDTFAQAYGTVTTASSVDMCDSRCRFYQDNAADGVTSAGYYVALSDGESFTDANGEAHACTSDECFVSCSAKDIYVGGDFCGTSAQCSTCSPEGTRRVEVNIRYTYQWLNTSPLFEVPASAVVGEPMAPYRYFVENAASTPFALSMVVQERADAMFGTYPGINVQLTDGISLSTDVDAAALPAVCKARYGFYLLQSRTTDGMNWSYSDGAAIHVEPLKVDRSIGNGSNTGSATYEGPSSPIFACNLMDAYSVQEKYSGSVPTSFFPRSSISGRAFAFEWPIVPNYMLDPRHYKFLGLAQDGPFRSTAPTDFQIGLPQDTFLEQASVARFLGFDGRNCIKKKSSFTCWISGFFGLFGPLFFFLPDGPGRVGRFSLDPSLIPAPYEVYLSGSVSDPFSDASDRLTRKISKNKKSCCARYGTDNYWLEVFSYGILRLPPAIGDQYATGKCRGTGSAGDFWDQLCTATINSTFTSTDPNGTWQMTQG